MADICITILLLSKSNLWVLVFNCISITHWPPVWTQADKLATSLEFVCVNRNSTFVIPPEVFGGNSTSIVLSAGVFSRPSECAVRLHTDLFNIAIDFILVSVCLSPILLFFDGYTYNMRHDRWQSGVEGFSASKLSYAQSFLHDGGEAWIGTNSTEPQCSIKVAQGAGEHGRTYVNGSQLSAKPNGEGDVDLISRVNLAGGTVFMARADREHDELISSRHYMIAHRYDEVMDVPDAAPSSVTRMDTDVLRGTSWFGIIVYYVTRFPGPLAVKVPVCLMIITLISRTPGLGALYPIMSILKTTWILIRTLVDSPKANDGSFDFWFWAFILSLFWPGYQCVKYLFVGHSSDGTPPHAGSHHSQGLSRSASRHLVATSRMAPESGDGLI